MRKQNIILIINPVAGRKKAKKITFQIVESIYKNDCKITIFITSEKGEAINIVRENCADAHQIICCGGDGTLNEVINGLALSKRKIPIGFIPTGTTNDLANAIGLPIQTKKAINVAVNGYVREYDIGSFNENQFFSYVASFGAFTKVTYTTPQKIKNLIGHSAYIFSGIMSIPDIKPYTLKVIADGREIEGDFIYGGVSNSTVLGGVFKLPKAGISFNDGMFEVGLVRNPVNPNELRHLIYDVVNSKPDDRYVYLFKARKISFIFEKEAAWTIDGEYAGTHNSVYIENLQCASLINAELDKQIIQIAGSEI